MEATDEDEKPSHRGRTFKALAEIVNSVHVALMSAADDDDMSIEYPVYDPAEDVDFFSDDEDEVSLAVDLHASFAI